MKVSGQDHDRVDDGLISILIPIFNEEESIEDSHRELTEVMQRWKRRYEIVLVNDGSTDRTGQVIDSIANSDRHVRAVHFRTNYGQTAPSLQQSTILAAAFSCRSTPICRMIPTTFRHW